MQHALIDLFLPVAVIINGCITGHIFGAMLGQLLAKVVTCVMGFDVKFIRADGSVSSIEHFRGYEAWVAMGDFEMLRRHARDNQAPGR